jgi:hypothetical protein
MRRKRKKSYLNAEPPTVDVDNLVIDTTRKERFHIFEVLASMRRYMIALHLASGVLSTFFAVQFLLGADMLASSLGFLVLAAMGFIGLANVICGLVLLASE